MSDTKSPDTRTRPAVPAPEASGCCGGPAPAGTDACCARDADAKVSGGDAAPACPPRACC
jgi:hypothetical protein